MKGTLLFAAALTFGTLLPPGVASATTYDVSDEPGFQAALSRAVRGDTVRLAAGTWETLAIANRHYGSGAQVTITGSAGTVSRGFTIVDTSGIRFTNLAFDGNGRDIVIGGKGNYGSNITIRRCSFTNADEFVHVHGGDTWLIEQNRFGQNNAGLTAVKFEPGSKTPQFRNVTVQNNLFHATGFGRIGVGVKAGQRLPGLPYNVRIVNNTIITTKSGVALSDGWDAWPRARQPIVADNVMKVFAPPWNTRGRLFSNVAEHGTAVPGVQIGPLNLNPDLSPSSASKLVIDRADRRFAPARDYFNHGRLRFPDRGAIEYLR